MGFRKTSIGINTRVLSDREVRADFTPRGQPPMDPEIGDMWEGMVWDGGAWVSQASWRTQQAREAGR